MTSKKKSQEDKNKELRNNTMGLIGLGIASGIGARAVENVGGDASGIKAFSGMALPIAGVAFGGKFLLDTLSGLTPEKEDGKKKNRSFL